MPILKDDPIFQKYKKIFEEEKNKIHASEIKEKNFFTKLVEQNNKKKRVVQSSNPQVNYYFLKKII